MNHCPQRNKSGGCQLHNLQCGYPSCDTPAAAPSAPAPAEVPLPEPVAWQYRHKTRSIGTFTAKIDPGLDGYTVHELCEVSAALAYASAREAAERERAKLAVAAERKAGAIREERVREQAASWRRLYRRAINAANGLTNYVEDRPELRRIERDIEAIHRDARAEDEFAARAELGEGR